jgi:hypothetical protein
VDAADAHPGPEALQRLADATRDALGDVALVAHVEACALCQTEVEEARRVAAQLSVAAPPPDGLLARVRARRAAGDRVLLPQPDSTDRGVGGGALPPGGHPSSETLDRFAGDEVAGGLPSDPAVAAHVAECAACAATVARLRGVTAALSLTSAPPDDLLARVRARREAGDRVLLPAVPALAVAREVEAPAARGAHHRAHPPHPHRAASRSVRWSVASAGAVAALLLATVTLRRGGPGAPSDAGVLTGGKAAPASPTQGVPAPRGGGAPAGDPGAGAEAGVPPVPPPVARGAVPPDARRAPDQLRSAGPVDGASPTAADTAAPAPDRVTEPVARTRATPAGIAVLLAGVPGADFAPAQAAALDSVAALLAGDARRGAVVRYTDPAFTRQSPSWDAARRVADYLALRGVSDQRVALARVAVVAAAGGRAPVDAVEVLVEGAPLPE